MRMGRDQTPSTKSRKPSADRFRQQRMDSWQPIMTPFKIISILVIVAILFIPAGCGIFEASEAVFEMRKVYDGSDANDVQCQVSRANEGRNCNISFVFKEDVPGPLLVQYELNRFYQNHRKYVSSFSSGQLMGKNIGPNDKGLSLSCDPSITNGTQGLNPCGLIAKSFFTDIITLQGSSIKGAVMDEKLISAESDRDVKFKQVDGFQSKVVSGRTVTCASAGLPADCKFYRDKSGIAHLYYYPNDNSVKYLYEMYPNQISPLEGVTNEHFIVWMRTAPLPKFRKLYGRIHQSFKKGDTLNFKVNANFEVRSFNGEKALIITNAGLLGSKNPSLGIAFIVIGCLSLLLASVFLMKEWYSPRKLGHGKLV